MIDELIKRLQTEVGLTEDEAIKSISVMKDHMDKEGLDIDWEKFFKGKTEDFLKKAKILFGNVSKQTQSYTDKLVDKVDDFADKARKSAHDLSKRAADFFDEK
ncbi:hypothetical protein JGH11_09940 [Dysgonomonas sp. Marseille-P4677]|uniref:hypothetical protein n=1 Tax=Dysgonomonas sp. Marseille-P4677 TaxID=2364790 RepID=UPI001911FA67|nr:hypothetical protein [Dysgonomonas sp. Marseille-P4677]MBK5721189.1 hypothetical protein [Dysgonomonas sp. Marseille-P4677]